jgi:hypothetical protein
MTKTRCSREVHKLTRAELELVSGGLIHEGTHAADSPTLGGGGQSWFVALANALGTLENRVAQARGL